MKISIQKTPTSFRSVALDNCLVSQDYIRTGTVKIIVGERIGKVGGIKRLLWGVGER